MSILADSLNRFEEKEKIWDARWQALTNLIASWSKDRSTKVGAVIVDDRQTVLAVGWNGFPRGINDDIDARHERPIKYKWTEHAERNAIYNAAARGISLDGSAIYTTLMPCADCTRGIIQSNIYSIITPEPNWNDERWGEDFRLSREMLDEANVLMRFVNPNTVS